MNLNRMLAYYHKQALAQPITHNLFEVLNREKLYQTRIHEFQEHTETITSLKDTLRTATCAWSGESGHTFSWSPDEKNYVKSIFHLDNKVRDAYITSYKTRLSV